MAQLGFGPHTKLQSFFKLNFIPNEIEILEIAKKSTDKFPLTF